jgi:hypothetical protein
MGLTTIWALLITYQFLKYHLVGGSGDKVRKVQLSEILSFRCGVEMKGHVKRSLLFIYANRRQEDADYKHK